MAVPEPMNDGVMSGSSKSCACEDPHDSEDGSLHGCTMSDILVGIHGSVTSVARMMPSLSE